MKPQYVECEMLGWGLFAVNETLIEWGMSCDQDWFEVQKLVKELNKLKSNRNTRFKITIEEIE